MLFYVPDGKKKVDIVYECPSCGHLERRIGAIRDGTDGPTCSNCGASLTKKTDWKIWAALALALLVLYLFDVPISF